MRQDLVGKKTAVIVRSTTAPTRNAIAIMSAGPYGASLLRATALNMHRRGEIQIRSPKPIWNEKAQQWEIEYRRLKPFPPRWRRPLLITLAILTPVSLLLLAAYWVAITLAAIPLATLLGVALLVLVVLVVLGKSGGTFIDVLVRIRIR